LGLMGQSNWLVAPLKIKKGLGRYFASLLNTSPNHLTWLQWTSTDQRTIHWMPIMTQQLWMNLNWVNIWFHLGNQFCSK
jgi:hypothetical protein